MIVETSGWRHLKEKKKLFLSCEYKKKVSSQPQNGTTSKNCLKSVMENFFSPLLFKKSNYVIRLFSNKLPCSACTSVLVTNTATSHNICAYVHATLLCHLGEKTIFFGRVFISDSFCVCRIVQL